MNKKIVVVLMLVAAMAVAAAGQDWLYGEIEIEDKPDAVWSNITLLPETYNFCAVTGNDIEIVISYDYESESPYVIHINEPDTIEAFYIEGREFYLTENTDAIRSECQQDMLSMQEGFRRLALKAIHVTFVAGAVAGLFVAWVCGW